MVSMVLAAGVALILACIILLSQKIDGAQLNEARASSPILGVQIICGDCSGGGTRPAKTFADRFGRCERCGGESYILASTSFARGIEFERAGRVLKFDKGLAARSARTKKIAV